MPSDILLFVFAIICALVVIILIGPLYQPSAPEKEWQVLTDAVLQKLSFEWKFVEEISEEVFAEGDEKMRTIACTFLGDMCVSGYYQAALVNSILERFCEVGLAECEEVSFSKKLVQAWPHLFKLLPSWKYDECMMQLEAKAIYGHQDEEIKLRRYKKKPTGRSKKDPPQKVPSWLENGLVPA